MINKEMTFEGDLITDLFEKSSKLIMSFDKEFDSIFDKTHAMQIDSKILKDEADKEYVLKDLAEGKELTLEYRGSEDGFKASDFQRNCYHKAKTLTIVKTTKGDVFGGYANVPWNSNKGQQSDNGAYLFSVNHQYKMKIKNAGQALYHSNIVGPWFADAS